MEIVSFRAFKNHLSNSDHLYIDSRQSHKHIWGLCRDRQRVRNRMNRRPYSVAQIQFKRNVCFGKNLLIHNTINIYECGYVWNRRRKQSEHFFIRTCGSGNSFYQNFVLTSDIRSTLFPAHNEVVCCARECEGRSRRNTCGTHHVCPSRPATLNNDGRKQKKTMQNITI